MVKAMVQMKIKGLFLDYDGTIGPLNVSRQESMVPLETGKILHQIKQLIPVGIITTKDLSFILPRTSFASVWCAVGGLETKIGDSVVKSFDVSSVFQRILLALEYARCRGGELFIEEKRDSTGQTIAFCVDWRHSRKREAKTKAIEVMRYCRALPLEVVEYGEQPFFDVYPCHIDKGKALEELKRSFGLQGGVMYMGDSKTDNPAFEVADISIGVLHRESTERLKCDYYVKFGDVSRLLERLMKDNMVFCDDFSEVMVKWRKQLLSEFLTQEL